MNSATAVSCSSLGADLCTWPSLFRLSMHHTSFYIQHARSLHVQLALRRLVRRSNYHRHLHFCTAIPICYDDFGWLARRGSSPTVLSITKSSSSAMSPYPKAGGPATIAAGSCSAPSVRAGFSGLMLSAADGPLAAAGGLSSALL